MFLMCDIQNVRKFFTRRETMKKAYTKDEAKGADC